MSTIAEKQKEIVEEFSMLDGDMEMTINYIMELGEQLPEMTEDQRSEENIVKGCQSKVWLTAADEGGKVKFIADSNTAITKGLVSLLVRVLSDEQAEDILKEEITFPQQIGMNRFIGTQRSNGFAAMIKQMKLYALALSSKTETSA
ncbi:SufE family protein [Marinoscillum furvescens]|uniref:Cysteine desulfuration protein SufE n=1 Tax=Marinoscillum furvescens DSM 4134 TaxID=1122208 RepID=A0A3D9L1L3_MARFU|nr:SufE family protein [Marinoscillum furvescens]RED96987.1 cysteine desulfuration protein SufE [Marinoscillum furvescens DSM 4134]